MKKILGKCFMIFVFIAAVKGFVFAGAKGSYIVTDFENEGNFKSSMNVKNEIVEEGARYGSKCMKITIGGITQDKWGIFGIRKIPKEETEKWKESGCDRLTFWLKGDAGSGMITLSMDEPGEEDWHYNGEAYGPKGKISLEDTEWTKIVIPFSDLKVLYPRKDKGNNIFELEKIGVIAFYPIKMEDPNKVWTFWIDQIQVETPSATKK